MKLKSFFANTIEEAIRLARQELGPDAMLVNSKRAGAEAQHLGFYEVVVCGDAPETGTRRDRGPESIEGKYLPGSLPVDKLSQDISELKQQLEKLALTLARSGRGMSSVVFDPDLSRAFTTLTDAELDTELAYDVVGKLTAPVAEAALRAELGKLVRVDSELGVPGAAACVVALVGPPGAGKTSALVKLAVQCGLTAGRPVRILTTDTYRIGAAEELRSFAAILGIGCQVIENPGGLSQAIADCGKDEGRADQTRQKDLILIDTPGLCRSEMEVSEDLSRVLSAHPSVDTHLVLPASMRNADLRRVSEQYSVFRPSKLLFTRMDETGTFGPILSRSVRMGKPISFFSRGQRIPEDLEPATTDLLLDLLLGALRARKFGMVAA